MTIPSDCQAVEPCCDSLYMLASDLAQKVARALVTCQADGSCEDMDAFVSHHRPIGHGHYVAVWLIRQRYSTTATNIVRPVPTFGIRYVQPGYPRLENVGGRTVQPERSALDAAAKHSYSHAQVMADAVRSTVVARRFGGCNSVTIERLEPDPIVAGYAGWTIEATWGIV